MMRKFLKVLVCMLLMLSCVMTPIAATAASRTAYILKVSADYARMRKGPYGNYGIITTLRKGTKVFYGGENAGAYCKVYLDNGVAGYVYRSYLSGYGAVNKNNVYMTTAPTTYYTRSGSSLKKAGTVGKGQFVLVYKRNGNWVFAKNLNGANGYMKLGTLRKVF